MLDPIPAGATPVATLGGNPLQWPGRWCCPFGSPYGFGEGQGWYLFPGEERDDTDARAFGRID